MSRTGAFWLQLFETQPCPRDTTQLPAPPKTVEPRFVLPWTEIRLRETRLVIATFGKRARGAKATAIMQTVGSSIAVPRLRSALAYMTQNTWT